MKHQYVGKLDTIVEVIIPNSDTVREYLSSGSADHLAQQILRGEPWFCDQVGIHFLEWSREILANNGFPNDAALHLVGSAANGFSLSPEKAGAPFRTLAANDRPSDLDFCLVDRRLFLQAWNSMVREDLMLGTGQRLDVVRVRVYWGRMDQYELLQAQKVQLRVLIDAIRRTPEYRGYKASIRLYRRREDLQGYTLWCLAQLQRAIEQ